MSVLNSLNRMVGAIVVLEAEREVLKGTRLLPPHLCGLIAELRATLPRWLKVLDQSREEYNDQEVTLFDDVALDVRVNK